MLASGQPEHMLMGLMQLQLAGPGTPFRPAQPLAIIDNCAVHLLQGGHVITLEEARNTTAYIRAAGGDGEPQAASCASHQWGMFACVCSSADHWLHSVAHECHAVLGCAGLRCACFHSRRFCCLQV